MHRRTVLSSLTTFVIGSSTVAPVRAKDADCEAQWREHVEFVEDEHERLREEYGEED